MHHHPEPMQRLQPSDGLPWHQHDGAYVAIVLEGGYSEAGDDGRRSVAAGDVVVHQPYCGHINRFERNGAVVVNFALSHAEADGLTSGRSTDPEQLANHLRAAPDGRAVILQSSIAATPDADDLPDLLAASVAVRNTCPARCMGRRARCGRTDPAPTVRFGLWHVGRRLSRSRSRPSRLERHRWLATSRSPKSATVWVSPTRPIFRARSASSARCPQRWSAHVAD